MVKLNKVDHILEKRTRLKRSDMQAWNKIELLREVCYNCYNVRLWRTEWAYINISSSKTWLNDKDSGGDPKEERY